MKRLFIIIPIMFFVLSCENEDIVKDPCSTSAIVKDLTGLDGCGYVFELNDGTILEPSFTPLFCGTPPLPKEVTEDPLYGFQFEDGKKVLISYEPVEGASICMAGQMVKVTCIQEVENTDGMAE